MQNVNHWTTLVVLVLQGFGTSIGHACQLHVCRQWPLLCFFLPLMHVVEVQILYKIPWGWVWGWGKCLYVTNWNTSGFTICCMPSILHNNMYICTEFNLKRLPYSDDKSDDVCWLICVHNPVDRSLSSKLKIYLIWSLTIIVSSKSGSEVMLHQALLIAILRIVYVHMTMWEHMG